jgi:hypothetical protein
MMALLVVADQYGLNPFTKEIYAFPDKGGIVPVVGVDGWSRIINSHSQFDGMEFKQDEESCTCIMYRKDRSHPVSVTEYMSECGRGMGPWKSHPKRMLRHKAMIQCARLAFSFVGIYDQDEAERIIEPERDMGAAQVVEVEKAFYPDDMFEANLPKWARLISSGNRTAEEVIAIASSRGELSANQVKSIKSIKVETAA